MSLQHAYRGGSTRDARPGWWVSFSYDQELIDRLKWTIPHTDREWNPNLGRWWVALSHEAELLALLPSLEAFIAQPQLF